MSGSETCHDNGKQNNLRTGKSCGKDYVIQGNKVYANRTSETDSQRGRYARKIMAVYCLHSH